MFEHEIDSHRPGKLEQPLARSTGDWPPLPALERTLRNLQELIPHERSALLLVEEANTVRLAAGRNLTTAVESAGPAPGLLQALRAGQPVLLDAAWLANLPPLAEDLAGGLAVPLRDDDALIGALVLAPGKPLTPADPLLPQLQAFTDQVALWLTTCRTTLTLPRVALSDIIATLNQSLDLEIILRDTLRYTLQAVGMEAGWVLLIDEPAAVARVAATYGLWPDAVANLQEIDLRGVNLTDIAHQLDQAVVVNDPARSPQLVQMVMRAQGLRAYVSIPLVVKDRLLGVLNAFSYTDRALGPEDVRLLTAIGRQVGVAIENAQLYEREARRVEQLRVINMVAREASSAHEAEQLLWRVVHLIHEALGYDQVSIALLEGDEVVVRASTSLPIGIRLQAGQDEPLSRVATRGEPLLVPAAGPAQETELAVPLRAQDRVIGVLDVRTRLAARTEPGGRTALSEDDLAVLGPLANQVGVAIENARLYESMRRQLAETTTLYQVSRAINSTPDLVDMLARVIDESLVAIGAERGCVLLRDEDTGALRFQVGRILGERPEPLSADQFAIDQTTVERVMSSGMAITTVATPGPHRRAILCVPLIIRGQTSGVIYIDNWPKAGPFSVERRDLLVGVAGQVAVAIENAQLYARIEELAASRERNRIAQEIHDTLTQQLSSVIMSLEASARLLAQADTQRSREQLDRAKELSRAALHDLRQYMFDLRRGEVGELGLVPMMRQYVREFALQTGLQADFAVDGPETNLGERANRALLRVLQEALANVRKHAHARRVTVQLAFSERAVVLSITDDGCGFDLWTAREKALLEKSFGLVGMQERLLNLGGHLEIRSEIGQGTQITATLPFGENLGGGRDGQG